MKILVLANDDTGLYLFRRELIQALLEKNEVLLALPEGRRTSCLKEMGCRFCHMSVERRSINPIHDLILLKSYLKLMRQEKPELVVTYTIKPNIYGGIACQLLRVPYAANITGLGTTFQNEGVLKKLVVVLYRAALHSAKTVFFENEGNLNILLEHGVVKREQCKLLNGAGVNLDAYPVLAYPEEDGLVRFIFIGRIMAEKGINELFAAMQRLIGAGYACCLDLLGYCEEDFKEEIVRYERQGWLHYHGFQDDPRPFIGKSHCLVLPSWHEGMANTNLECSSMGRPLITSNIHGCKEAVVENVSGLLCEPKNQDSLYEAMKLFLELSNEERKAMGMAGRRHMERVFDKKTVVAETMKGLGL